MKKIALTLLVVGLFLEAGCSRPTADAPIVAASPTPGQLTAAHLPGRQVEPMAEVAIPAPSPTPVSSPRP